MPRATAAVLVPVGPDPAEPARLADLVDALATFERASVDAIVLVDDAPAPRDLRAAPFATTVVRTGVDVRSADAFSAHVAGTLAGLDAASDHDVIVKLDTDALVVAPFLDALAAAAERALRTAIFGSYDRTCTGAPRDFSVWRRPVRRLTRPVLARRRAPFVQVVAREARRRRAEVVAAARANGYVAGEHCLGGGYAVTGRFARELARRGWLDPAPWLGTWLGEDVTLGLMARACGYALEGLVAPGEPFGLARAGLPAPPEQLIADGHAIVHSVATDARHPEAELREYFRARRVAARQRRGEERA